MLGSRRGANKGQTQIRFTSQCFWLKSILQEETGLNRLSQEGFGLKDWSDD